MVEQCDSPQQPERFAGHLQDVHALCVDGNLVATGSRDTSTRLYDRASGECVKVFGRGVPRGELQHVKGRDVPPIVGNTKPESGGHSSDVNSVCLSSSRGVLYTAGECLGSTDFVKAWDLETGVFLQDLQGHHEGVFALAKSEKRGLLFSASTDRTVRVWDMNTNQCVHVLEEHTDKVRCLHWDEEHELLLSGSHDNQVFAWSPKDWTMQFKLTEHKDWVTSVTACPDHIATTSTDKTTKLWDWKGNLVQSFTHESWAVSCCFFQDLILTALGDGTLTAHNVSTKERAWNFAAHKEHNPVSMIVPLTEDRVLTCSWDSTVKEWSREGLDQAGQAAGPQASKQAVEAIEPAEAVDSVLDGDIFGADDVQ
jgi:WD40 repeat protein